MSQSGMIQQQKASQVQTQIMSQKQIMAVKLIGMGSFELRNEILSQAEENPALEIVRDPFAEGTGSVRKGDAFSRRNELSVSGRLSRDSFEASDTFQQLLESSPDHAETLQEHLIHQLNMTKLSELEYDFCRRLIENLDERGFHILAPVTLLDKNNPEHTQLFLEDCLYIVREFEPSGICVKDVTESLEVQAENLKNKNRLVKFILHGNLDFLSSPQTDKVVKRLNQYLAEQKKLSFVSETDYSFSEKDVTARNVEDAVNFIQSLNPFPARDFSAGSDTVFIRPDAYVTRVHGLLEKENPEAGTIFISEDSYFRVSGANDVIPELKLASDFEKQADFLEKEQKKFIQNQVKNASNFIELLEFRKIAVIRSLGLLVKYQRDFFEKGPGNIKPLTQRQFAELSGIHESSVSRFAESKFFHCDWGTFPVKYLFSTALQKPAVQEAASSDKPVSEVSAERIKHEIEIVLSGQKPGEKRLSDQKISDILAEKGISVARRTVAKYRAQMNIDSSYTR